MRDLHVSIQHIPVYVSLQRVPGGTHTLRLEAGADKVSPGPCSSHALLAQVHTNLKDRIEHHLQLDLCPPHPVRLTFAFSLLGLYVLC